MNLMLENKNKSIFFTNSSRYFSLLLVLIVFFTATKSFASQFEERNLTLDENIAAQIQGSFLYSKKETAIIDNYKNYDFDQDISVNENQGNKYNFVISKSKSKKYDINLDKKTQEKTAYNAYINGQYEIAIKIYKELIKKNPFDTYPKYCLALTYQKLKQYRDAKEIYFKLLTQNPENKEDIVANLMVILSEESPKDAIYHLTKLANQNPDSGYFLAQKALILEKIGNHKMAIQDMKRATLLEPKRADYQFNLAVIYDRSEKYEEALEAYYNVLKEYKSGEEWGYNIPINQVISRIDVVKTFI